MAISKADAFPTRDQRIARLAKAISHPARIAILRFLSENGVSESGDISKSIPLSQSTIAQHLKGLRREGLIVMDNRHIKLRYQLNAVVLAEMREILQQLFGSLQG